LAKTVDYLGHYTITKY